MFWHFNDFGIFQDGAFLHEFLPEEFGKKYGEKYKFVKFISRESNYVKIIIM